MNGSVSDFNRKTELKFLRGMCFNNASTLISNKIYVGQADKVTIAKDVFSLAEELMLEAERVGFLDWDFEMLQEKKQGGDKSAN